MSTPSKKSAPSQAVGPSTLPTSYVPQEQEAIVMQRWEETDATHIPATPHHDQDCFSILIPPPNVTAALHLGHALNNTLQDILIRYHRMSGDEALWMAGTDHAGIATQTVVEKRLLQEGKRRTDFSREAFVARVQEWKDEYEATILNQLKALGASCDWPRTRFTMDPVCARAVHEAFFQLFQASLIERGKRLVNWDPVTLTALADDEVEMQDIDSFMWYLRYPLEHAIETNAGTLTTVTVATTRPETMLGDTAIAINPADPRAKQLVGMNVIVPIVNRTIPIIEDDYVIMPGTGDENEDPKAAFASGFLKVTPAHDPNDWDIGRRHELPIINVMAPDGSISSDHGWPANEFENGQADDAKPFIGLSREDARTAIVQWFQDNDLLEEIRPYSHAVGHSYRSHVPIEPYLSDQWYVKVTDDRLVGEAQRAQDPNQYDGCAPERADHSHREGDGQLKFFPPRYARMYQSWHDQLRDWCISRQLWWGHQIPVWRAEPKVIADLADQLQIWTADKRVSTIEAPEDSSDAGKTFICVRDSECDDTEIAKALDAAGAHRDPDVLDTWFSSALWPISTMGWPDPDRFEDMTGLLERFNPTSVLSTGRDIITLWVSRMVMFNRFFMNGNLPFRDVYIHPMVQDGFGQRMSKSLGNGVDPRDIIATHGVDALRFTMAQIATNTQDVRLSLDLICPFTGEVFQPKFITSPAGYQVTAPTQVCPSDPNKTMATSYGVAIGEVQPTPEQPLAKNSSSKFDLGRNFSNKLWNATRFVLSKLPESAQDSDNEAPLSPIDRWMLTQLSIATRSVNELLGQYQFSQCIETLYDLIWRDFCDWYLESIKPTVADSPGQQRVLSTALDVILRLLHPICPFVTETLWPAFLEKRLEPIQGVILPVADSLMLTAWPTFESDIEDVPASKQIQRLQVLVNAIRQLRAEHKIPPRELLTVQLSDDLLPLLDGTEEILSTLTKVTVDFDTDQSSTGGLSTTVEGHAVILRAADIDTDQEINRLNTVIKKQQQAIAMLEGRLNNPGYVKKAPPQLVEESRAQLEKNKVDLAAAQQSLESLSTSKP
ncbi:MAG: valine--tRNA ligase [Phycisphaerales bacterium]|nr:valine--tRNA ligase [Phycisphaerales bacterium]